MSDRVRDKVLPAYPDRDDCIDLATTLTIEELRTLLAGAITAQAQDELAEKLVSDSKCRAQPAGHETWPGILHAARHKV